MRAILAILVLALPVAADSLDDLLKQAGFERGDLGWKPKGHWIRFPRAVTHKLDHFDSLFAEPFAAVPYVRVLGRAVETYLSAEGLAKQPVRGAHSLYRAVHILGINRRHGGIRPYSPNLLAKRTPLDQAILALYRYAKRQTRFVTFATESPYPQLEKDLKAAVGKIDPDNSEVLGRLVLDLLDAHAWAVRAFRNVPLEKRVAVARRIDLGMESVDALEYAPECDDVARLWDEASLWYAAGKCVQALENARRELMADTASFRWETPLGTIVVNGIEDHRIEVEDPFLVIDLGGNDTYIGRVGASSPTRPIGLCLDLEGDDTYFGKRVVQGAGICGIGVLMDVKGKDRYTAVQLGQGLGQFGFGALVDLDGKDEYTARWSAQGCGYFGVGMLLDCGAADDRYELHADGQGFGGVGGVGVLADYAGNELYRADPDARESGRPSYHSELKVSVSNAQGCAMGRRGDGADGHNWAGGFGLLLDAKGDDSYVSGNWSMGTGYWFGMGALWDGAGNDSYDGHVWSQATGAHFCLGVLLDEGGDDRHLSRAHNSIAFGHDFTIALLVNTGGNDRYETPKEGLGFSINRSVAALIDVGGDDVYKAKNVPGFARFDKRFLDRRALSTYWVEAKSLGLFLDIGGKDTYPDKDLNNQSWSDAPDSDNRKARNPGAGADIEKGTVNYQR
jgi:hypothetical protein